MMPTGISAGARAVRATVSASSSSSAPNRALAGSRRRWSGPTSSRMMWGTISPTKPMSPEKATAAAVVSEATIIRLRRVRWLSTPSSRARSSPMSSRFIRRDMSIM